MSGAKVSATTVASLTLPSVPERVCLSCGRSLEGRRRHAKTCSGTCRQRLHAARRKASTWSEQRAVEWGLEARDFWRTPPALFAALDALVGPFGLDAATAGEADAHCARFLTPDDDALTTCWATASGGRPVFVNPPYSRRGGRGLGLLAWVRAAVRARDAGVVVAMVLPSARGTAWARLLREEAPVVLHPAGELARAGRVAFIHPDSGLAIRQNRGEAMVPILRPDERGPPMEPDWTGNESWVPTGQGHVFRPRARLAMASASTQEVST